MAIEQLERLFPNKHGTHVPGETEEDPSSDVDDDFDTTDFDTPAGLRAREAEHERAATAAAEAGVPARRSGRAASRRCDCGGRCGEREGAGADAH